MRRCSSLPISTIVRLPSSGNCGAPSLILPKMLKGIAKKDLASLKKEIDYVALCKLAIEQADGVILQSPNINQELVEYTKSLGKPVLEYQAPEAYADACSDFYNMVMESNNEETNE